MTMTNERKAEGDAETEQDRHLRLETEREQRAAEFAALVGGDDEAARRTAYLWFLSDNK